MINKYGTKVQKPKGAIHKSTQIKSFMRNDILKHIMQLPLREFASKNADLKAYVEAKFGDSADELTVEMAMVSQNVGYNIMNPNAKDFSYIMAELYGKVKEEANNQIIELPPMQDATDILNSMTDEELQIFINQRKSLNSPPIEPPTDFELVALE